MLQEKDASATAQKWAEQFAKTTVCPECKGARLNKEALHFRIHDKISTNWRIWTSANYMIG